ncbi:MAG: HAD-IA family hydrolase [Candidatus Dormibacteraeota bacterium]|uniref:HAD-IA family hydrolase n=1 Tax=Candidatus Nephthysia bennettiae TaxID=3127016 RepID=A0A934K0S0_9BACT|nr:HAD-IA family hydrolase [Candidatus Dormibacteraeota bacterium]
MMGVLTSDLFDGYRSFSAAESLPDDALVDFLTKDPEGHRLLVDVERGVIGQRDFELGIGRRFGIDGERLVERVWDYLRPEPLLLEFVRRARSHGIKAGLLSNSLGTEPYNACVAWNLVDEFDSLVISGEVGLRKPDPEIFELAVKRLAVPAEACVFVDDMEHNLGPAREAGLTVVRHTEASKTIAELERLFGNVLNSQQETVPRVSIE